MNHVYKIVITILLLVPNTIKANDTLFKLAQPLATAHNWSYKGGGTNLDADPAWKTSLTYVETNWLTNKPALSLWNNSPSNFNTTILGDNTAGGAGPTGKIPNPIF
ncbi:MAG: hypothetical protein IPP48_08295 [Chitinophagaceae bacterium]|nr:hypothetical protein [Chitinophagaceae bacterium]